MSGFRGKSRGGFRGRGRGSSRGGSRGGFRGGRGGYGNKNAKSVQGKSHFSNETSKKIRTEVNSDSDSAPEEEGWTKRDFADDGVDSEAGSDDDGFFEEGRKTTTTTTKKKKNKHAPKETKINHRPVGVVRDIPGLEIKKDYTGDGSYNGGLYGNRDVRFDTALGKSVDYEVVRKQYAFLDEYREKEIAEMQGILKNKKLLSRMDENEIEELKYKLQSTRSKLESLKKKDREKEALKSYLKEQKEQNGGMKFLTRAEKRKVVLVDRFENMDSKQKNKSIERKRKRKLGKEMRALEFGRQ